MLRGWQKSLLSERRRAEMQRRRAEKLLAKRLRQRNAELKADRRGKSLQQRIAKLQSERLEKEKADRDGFSARKGWLEPLLLMLMLCWLHWGCLLLLSEGV